VYLRGLSSKDGVAFCCCALAGCVALLTGCQMVARDALSVWAAGDWRQVLPDSSVEPDDPLIFDRAQKLIRLRGARNEVVSFQLVLTGKQAPVRNVTVRLGKLVADGDKQAEIPAEAIRAYRVGYVEAGHFTAAVTRLGIKPDGNSRFPDPLIPLAGNGIGQPFDISAGTNQAIWIDIRIPAAASAGRYRSQIHVAADGRVISTVNVELKVLQLRLADEGPVEAIAILDLPKVLEAQRGRSSGGPIILGGLDDPAEVEHLCAMVDSYVQAARLAGVRLWPGRVYPRVKLKPDGRLRVWWDGYQRLRERFLAGDGGQVKIWWPVPLNLSYPAPEDYGGLDSPLYGRVLQQYLSSIRQQLCQDGSIKCCLMASTDALTEQRLFDTVLQRRFATLARKVRQQDAPISVVNPFVPQSLIPFGATVDAPAELETISDIYCPPAAWWDPRKMAALRSAGKAVWWHGGDFRQAPATVATSCFGPRAWPWIAYRYGSSAVVIPEFNDWPSDPYEGAIDEQRHGSDRWWVYPGGPLGLDGAVPSIRLMMLRRGLQDVKYLKLLEDRGIKSSADWIARRLVRHAHLDSLDGSLLDVRNDAVATNGRTWELARRVMQERLAGSAGEKMDDLLAKIDRQQLIDATSQALLEVEGIRVRKQSASGEPTATQWDFHVAIRNYRDEQLAGVLRFAALGQGWRIVADRVKVGPLGWAVPRRARLTLASPRLWTNGAGLFNPRILFEISEPGAWPLETRARSAALVSQLARQPITIDGKLNDWPVGWTNTAGDFLLIAPDGRVLADRQRRPTQQTQASVAHDGRNLYFAFVCDESQPQQIVARPSNTVHFEGLLAWGEDLVEVLIDPLNSSSTNPADVYHLIVKANGTVISYRGVPTAPALRGCGPWASGAVAAVQVNAGSWVAEIALPLKDLAASQTIGRWWGLNLARHEARLGESSSWSGAKRHFCSPRSLGNLLIPQ